MIIDAMVRIINSLLISFLYFINLRGEILNREKKMKKILIFMGISFVLSVNVHAETLDCPPADKVEKQIKEALSTDLATHIVVKSGLARNQVVGKIKFPIVDEDQKVTLKQTKAYCEYLVNEHRFLVIKR